MSAKRWPTVDWRQGDADRFYARVDAFHDAIKDHRVYQHQGTCEAQRSDLAQLRAKAGFLIEAIDAYFAEVEKHQ